MTFFEAFLSELEKIAGQYEEQLSVPRDQLVQVYKGVYPVPQPSLLERPKIKKVIGTTKRVGTTALKMLQTLERQSQMPIRRLPSVPRSIL